MKARQFCWRFKWILCAGCVVLARILNSLHLISRQTCIYITQEAKWIFLEYSTLPQKRMWGSPNVGVVYNSYKIDGVSQVGNDFVYMLKHLNLPVQLFDNSSKSSFGQELSSRIKIYFTTLQCHKEKEYYNIITPFWEFESGMLEYRPLLFDRVNEAFVFSDFCYNYFKRIAPKEVKLTKIRYPLTKRWKISQSSETIRARYGVRNEDFMLFFNFSYGSSYHRKNPEAILKAFAQALGDKTDAKMIIKTVDFQLAKHNVLRLANLAKQLHIQDRIVFINEYLSYDNTMELLNASDAYISLHRGEGFGIGMLEAMALGKPVIATNYGGNTEFTRKDTALLVDYKLVRPAEIDNNAYKWVSMWAEPNIDTAAKHLYTLYNDRAFGLALAQNATGFINDYFSPQKFKNDILHLFL